MYTEHIWTTGDQLGLSDRPCCHNVSCTGHMYRQDYVVLQSRVHLHSGHRHCWMYLQGCILVGMWQQSALLRLTGSVSYSRSTRAPNHLHRDTTLAFHGVAKHRAESRRNALQSVCIWNLRLTVEADLTCYDDRNSKFRES
jgi:hypothetical protein